MYHRLQRLFRRNRFVVVESPYAGDVSANVAYAEWAALNCARRGESPYASHLLLTRILRDANPEHRELGLTLCNAVEGPRVYYVDRCPSPVGHDDPKLHQTLEDQQDQVRGARVGYTVLTIGWSAILAALVAFIARTDVISVGGVAAVAAVWYATGRIAQLLTLALYCAEFLHADRVFSSGMFRAFIAHPGEIRRLPHSVDGVADVLTLANHGVGPLGRVRPYTGGLDVHG